MSRRLVMLSPLTMNEFSLIEAPPNETSCCPGVLRSPRYEPPEENTALPGTVPGASSANWVTSRDSGTWLVSSAVSTVMPLTEVAVSISGVSAVTSTTSLNVPAASVIGLVTVPPRSTWRVRR